MDRHALSEYKEILQPQGFTDLRAGLAADHNRLDLGQVTLKVLGVLQVEQLII